MPGGEEAELLRTLITLTPQQHEWLRTRAFHAKTSMASEIRELVQRAMDTERRSAARSPRAKKGD